MKYRIFILHNNTVIGGSFEFEHEVSFLVTRPKKFFYLFLWPYYFSWTAEEVC